jgi:Ca2+-binding RTX toxin-like protein
MAASAPLPFRPSPSPPSLSSPTFKPKGKKGEVQVSFNGAKLGLFRPTGRLIAFGLAGDDVITVDKKIRLPAELDGGEGNDRLTGARGPNVLVGGRGDDRLTGSSGRDLLICGWGADRLKGSSGDDLLIGGSTPYDDDAAALHDIAAVWTSAQPFASRVAALQDSTRPRYLKKGETVLDDQAVDALFGRPGMDWLVDFPMSS